MAVPARTKQRDPKDPVQILRTKKHGEVRVDGMSFMDGLGVGIHIVKTPAGGYRHARGGPIRNESELRKAIPKGPELDKALAWWANKDKWQETAPRKVGFETGTGFPIFEDTGDYVEREEDLLTNWPGDSPIFWAALKALEKRREAKVEQPEPRVTLGVVQAAPAPAPAPSLPEQPKAEVASTRLAPLLPSRHKKLTATQKKDRATKIAATKAAKEAKAATMAKE